MLSAVKKSGYFVKCRALFRNVVLFCFCFELVFKYSIGIGIYITFDATNELTDESGGWIFDKTSRFPDSTYHTLAWKDRIGLDKNSNHSHKPAARTNLQTQ